MLHVAHGMFIPTAKSQVHSAVGYLSSNAQIIVVVIIIINSLSISYHKCLCEH